MKIKLFAIPTKTMLLSHWTEDSMTLHCNNLEELEKNGCKQGLMTN